MSEIFLHVGLHKTATKYFQHRVFPHLPAGRFLYNPPKLTQLLADLLKADDADCDAVLAAIADEKTALARSGATIVISREIMSGDLFGFYRDFDTTQSRLARAVPEARLILFLRFQPDWIVSCYRETVHEHHFQTFAEFVRDDDRRPTGFVGQHYSTLDLIGIVEGYFRRFGRDRVSCFFYEDFVKNRPGTIAAVTSLVGWADCPHAVVTGAQRDVPNRGYSALAIRVSLARYRACRALGLDRLLVHRPIRFFGPGSIPAGFEQLSVLPSARYWGPQFLRDNEEVRSAGYPDQLSVGDRFRLATSWRRLIKQGLDRVAYLDWDVAGDLRPELEAYFRQRNVSLPAVLGLPPEAVPQRYLAAPTTRAESS